MMKNYILPKIFFILLTLISFSSCSSEDDEVNDNDNTGNATYDGTSINLTQGAIINYGEIEEGVYNFDIDLLSDDFDIDFENQEVNGGGENVYFEMWTSQSSGLKEGTYKMTNGEADFGISVADFSMNYNFDTDEGTIYEANDAELTLSKSGNTYSLDFTLSFSNGKTLTGKYEGSLYELNED